MSLRANSLIPQSTHSEFDWKLEVVGKQPLCVIYCKPGQCVQNESHHLPQKPVPSHFPGFVAQMQISLAPPTPTIIMSSLLSSFFVFKTFFYHHPRHIDVCVKQIFH